MMQVAGANRRWTCATRQKSSRLVLLLCMRESFYIMHMHAHLVSSNTMSYPTLEARV